MRSPTILKLRSGLVPGLAMGMGALALLSGLSGCDADEATVENVASVVTYNVGLATGYVDYAPQREGKLVEMIAGLDADLVCLQEVWTQEQVDAIIAGSASAFPHNYYVIDSDDTVLPAQCTQAEADTLGACVASKCADTPASELSTCVIGAGLCAAEFAAMAPICQGCGAANLGKEVTEILDICTAPGSQKYSWGGHNGLLILSKGEIKATHHTKLTSSLVQRSVLGVDVSLEAFGDASFFCTHLAADLTGEIAYTGDFKNFEAENAAQTVELLSFVDTHAAGSILIAGDMNSGPERAPEIEAEIPDAAYALITAAGYKGSPDNVEARCTWCTDNTFVGADGQSRMIDHVFAKNLGSRIAANAISFIGTTTFEVTPEGGSPVQTNPSDHIGFRVQFDKIGD